MSHLDNISPIDVYKLVLIGKISRFPKDFWNSLDSDVYVPEITKFLIEDILKWNNLDIKNKLRKKTFEENKLRGMLYLKYRDSPYQAITSAYPERNYKPWDFVNTPNSHWQGEQGKLNAKVAIKWLFEEKLKWTIEDIKNNANQQVFTENNLLGMLKKAFDSDLFTAIDFVYPGQFKRWEVGVHVRNNYWNKEEGILATKWLIEVRLKWSDLDIKKYFNKQIFMDNGLYGMLQMCFNSSPYEAINTTYPDKFKEWELPYVPKNFWNEKTCYEAMKWLIEENLNISKNDNIKKYISKNILISKGLCVPFDKYGINGLIKLYREHQ